MIVFLILLFSVNLGNSLLLQTPPSNNNNNNNNIRNKNSATTTNNGRLLDKQQSSCSSSLVHTLILCRHGDSIWNGGQPGLQETFTGWTNVPLSSKGIQEAKQLGNQLAVQAPVEGIDVCFTSLLQRAQMTAHYCLWSETGNIAPHCRYVTDYRLNERHYGALQGYVKADVEQGIYREQFDPQLVQDWRRSWYTVPPLLDSNDPRRVEELRHYANACGGPENVPLGESLDMVANNRIQPMLEDTITPLLNQAAQQNNNNDEGATGLIVAHANSLRALIGVLCGVTSSDNPKALRKLEAMKIQTGVPLVIRYIANGNNRYQSMDNNNNLLLLDDNNDSIQKKPLLALQQQRKPRPCSDLPVWYLHSLPLLLKQEQQQEQDKETINKPKGIPKKKYNNNDNTTNNTTITQDSLDLMKKQQQQDTAATTATTTTSTEMILEEVVQK